MNAQASRADRLLRHVPFVDLSTQNRAVRADVLADIERLLDEGAFVNGPAVAEFERAFAGVSGSSECVGVASGLDALRLGLIGAGLEPGDEVVVPAMTFVATFEAVVQAGGVPVPVDVRADDAGLDPSAAEAACGPRTRFVLPVHLYGQPADLVALRELAERRDLVMIEDACQAHGAERDGIRAGNAGLAAAFSFYPSKNLGAMGDAGALVTDDAALAERVRTLRQHGEGRRYHSDRIGYTARLDTLQALVLLRKLPYLDRWNADRIRAASVYSTELEDIGDLRLPVTVANARHVWHLYTVRTAEPTRLAEYLSSRGVATGRHYPEPPHLSDAFAYLGHRVGAFPVAEAIGRETLSLPIFPGITDEQLEIVVSAISEYFTRG